jgi:hypothetical protein
VAALLQGCEDRLDDVVVLGKRDRLGLAAGRKGSSDGHPQDALHH